MDTSKNKQIMARNIKKYMERKGVSNQMLCDDLGFKYTTFLDWIKGVTYPRIGKVEAMAQYFGCEKSDLIEEKDDVRPFSVTHLANGISIFKGSDQDIQRRLSDIDDEFRVVYQSQGVTIIVDNGENPTDEAILSIVSLYANSNPQSTETDELGENKKALYDFIDTLSEEQVQRLLQIGQVAFDK